MGWLVEYFNLSFQGQGVSAVTTPISWGWQLVLYGALVLGILANGFLAAARAKRRYRFHWQSFLAGAIIGLVAFPAVYDGAQTNLGQPTLVQLALIFAAGLGYESVFGGVASLAGSLCKG